MMRKVLLLGSGFSFNFGGFLPDRVFLEIFNHPKLTENLREKLEDYLETNDFEAFYFDVTKLDSSEFSTDEKENLKKVLLDIYCSMDESIKHHLFQKAQLDFSYRRIIGFIIKNFGYKRGGSGYIFSLNQDLLLERLFVEFLAILKANKPSEGKSKGLMLPHYGPINTPFYEYHAGDERQQHPTDWRAITKEQIGNWEERCQNSYEENARDLPCLIKLHGSYYWEETEADPTLILGKTNKEKDISEIPILNAYFKKFQSVMKSELDICIIGYGFKDPHINKVIFDACRAGSRLTIVDILPLGKLIEKLKQSYEGFNTEWINKYHNLSFKELFPLREGQTNERETNLGSDHKKSIETLVNYTLDNIF